MTDRNADSREALFQVTTFDELVAFVEAHVPPDQRDTDAKTAVLWAFAYDQASTFFELTTWDVARMLLKGVSAVSETKVTEALAMVEVDAEAHVDELDEANAERIELLDRLAAFWDIG